MLTYAHADAPKRILRDPLPSFHWNRLVGLVFLWCTRITTAKKMRDKLGIEMWEGGEN